jgi:hypothetical protein
MPDEISDELDDEDVSAITESERQIACGEDLDWKTVSAELRRRYLGNGSTSEGDASF